MSVILIADQGGGNRICVMAVISGYLIKTCLLIIENILIIDYDGF
jgi:hypothetical protein